MEEAHQLFLGIQMKVIQTIKKIETTAKSSTMTGYLKVLRNTIANLGECGNIL